MKKSKKLTITLIVLVCVAIAAGITIYAASNAGSQSDPLVALSYLNDDAKDSFMESANASINKKAGEIRDDFDGKLSDLESEIDAKIASSGGTSSADVFSVVTLSSGDTVVCGVGVEIMLRIGTAEAYGEDWPALIDTTTSQSVGEGTDLVTNHMYMVTISGCGIRATSGTVKVIMRGDYTIR
ncbi:MAG: hypothetical protein J5569_05950 [Oscillospiraceae bacterium]|nr:hypothetical protein [Oscillospiraceae bacterium]